MRTKLTKKQRLTNDLNRIAKRFDAEHLYLGVYTLCDIPVEIAERVKAEKSLTAARIFVDGLADAIEALQAAQQNAPAPVIYTFGVEIECYVNRTAFIDDAHNALLAIRDDFESCYSSIHRDDNAGFKVVRDGSVSGGLEVVSPVMQTSDFSNLEKVCVLLNANNAKVNRNCGLHVHIGAADMTPQQYINVFINYMYLEPIIDASLAPSRRENKYCRTMRGRENALLSMMGEADFAKHDVEDVFDYNRYFKVNACAYERHRTIEFRQHQGSTDFVKIRNWVEFLTSLCEWSKTHRLTEFITNKADERLQGLAVNKLRVMPN